MRGTTPPVAKPAPAPKTHNPSHRTFADSEAMEVVEAAHDPELDEAVIAFANADFGMSEEILRRLIQEGGARAGHLETWLVLFDFTVRQATRRLSSASRLSSSNASTRRRRRGSPCP